MSKPNRRGGAPVTPEAVTRAALAPHYGPRTVRFLTELRESAAATVEADVSDKPWSEFSASDYDGGQWHKACVLHTHDGEPSAKSECKLPVREPDGTLNRNGVHAAAARIGQVDATAAQKKTAAKALVRAYGTLKEDPPESLANLAKEAAANPAAGRTAVRETASVVAGHEATPGHFRLRLIEAGWSLNNAYYSAEVLRRDGPSAWPAGRTLCYIDHATDAQEEDYPSGSIRNLAAVLTTDAQWNETTQALEADARVFSLWREPLAEMAPYIGMSIRAWVYADQGEAEGRSGLIVNSIAEGRSVDFVTVPAAGGAILSVLESVQRSTAEARNIGAWLESRLHLALTTLGDDMYGDGRLTRDERITLSAAIGDALTAWTTRVQADAPQLFQRDLWTYPEPAATTAEEARRVAEATAEQIRTALQDEIADTWGGAGVYVWVRDFDPDNGLVWFDTCPADSSDTTTWQQAYTADGQGGVALDGDRTEVVARTVYDPAPAEDEPDDAATESVHAPPPAAAAAGEQTTDGDPPAVPNPTDKEGPDMSGTETGAPPAQAGTAPVVDTPPNPAAETATAANAAVITAMEALTRQVTALTEANTALTARADQRDAADRAARNRQAAREAVAAALAAPEVPADLREQIGPRVTAAVLADVPVTDLGDLDTARLTEAVTAAITAESGYAAGLLESAGVGRPRGLGSQPVQPQTTAEFEATLAEGFRALGLSENAAKIAAQGRS